MSDTATTVAIATVVSGVIAGIAGWLTQRSAARATVRVAETTTRGDIEKEAFERAQGFYTDTIDRQAGEIRDLETDVDRLKVTVATQAKTIRDQGQQISVLRAELETAKNALRLAFPDEP